MTRFHPKDDAHPRGRLAQLAGKARAPDSEPEKRDQINHVYLTPLRDAQRELDSASGSRLAHIMKYLVGADQQGALARHAVFTGNAAPDRRGRRAFRGTSVINVGSVDFSPYIRLLLTTIEGARLADQLIVITDADPALPAAGPERESGSTPENVALQTPSHDAWPDIPCEPGNCLTHSTVHGYKGLQSPAVALVIPKRPADTTDQDDGVHQWFSNREGESRRVLYVGASRAQQLLILAVHQSRATDVRTALDRDGVSYINNHEPSPAGIAGLTLDLFVQAEPAGTI